MSSQPSSNSTYSNVFIVGSTGTVGKHVTKAFLQYHPHAQIKILVRKESEEKASELRQLGAQIVNGDLTTIAPQELDQILHGSDVIVSTVFGDASTIVDGQLKLLESAKRVGVKKFLPSSFGVNSNKLEYGDLLPNDNKKKFADELVKSGLEYVFVNTGLFYSYATLPNFLFEFDKDTNTVKFDGDLNAPLTMTDLEDIGKFTAEAALRKDIKNRDVDIKGDIKSIREVATLLYGNDVKFVNGLNVSELKQEIDHRIKSGVQPQDFFSLLVLQLRWIFATGKTAPEKYANDELFPTIQPKSFVEFAATLPKQ
ncbi:hypothetical protein C9374_010586 [Naegleria lovaniensis]|uniref:NmrA-like domain-containing protein n=1 Tax=Naegleria lovaniensis TaxID=51637 RepID=A0AA88GBE2_NAELO|nr:uncharacterized protein C9374_010586 [Naegleria lovaniensis]KAG2374567.1 hypothetical protein C9374_010586 [Naegleria lovaniensis]